MGFLPYSCDLFLLKWLVAVGQEHVLCLDEAEIVVVAANGSCLVNNTLYILAKMIESSVSYSNNGGAGFGKGARIALDDEEIRDLNTSTSLDFG